jgi:hypothetical protein
MSAPGVRREKAVPSSGCKPTRQPLEPEAIEAVMEVTKWLKPSISVLRIGDSTSVQAAGRNAIKRRASLEKDNAQVDRMALSGKADTAGLPSQTIHPAAAPE